VSLVINNIFSLVRELVASLPGISKVAPPVPVFKVDDNLPNVLLLSAGQKQKSSPGAPRGEVDLPGKENVSSSMAFQDAPVLIPLPVKTPLFAEARFYVQQEREERAGNIKKTGIILLIILNTVSLGLLRLFLNHKDNDLVIQWITQTDEARNCLQQGFSELKKEIIDLGYTTVIFNIQCLSKDGESNQHTPDSDLHIQGSIFSCYI